MLIGISSRSFTSEYVDIKGVPYTYLKVIDFIIIDSENKIEDIDKVLSLVDGIKLPGGDKIISVDDYIINYCYVNNKPLLGICLGMQELAHHFGSSIVKTPSKEHFNFDAKYQHIISIKEDSYMYNLLNNESIPVNSRHNYMIESNDSYDIMACYNNVIEAIKVKNTYYMVGYQFHHEIMKEYDDNAKVLFNDFINKVKEKSNQ